jgi:hypothetical protein
MREFIQLSCDIPDVPEATRIALEFALTFIVLRFLMLVRVITQVFLQSLLHVQLEEPNDLLN